MMKKYGFAPLVAGAFLFAMLFVFSEKFISGINSGLMNCARIIVPCIFPFLIASSIAGYGKLPPILKKFFDPVTHFLFRLPAECLFSIILAQFGGYLSGAKSAQTLYSNGIITNKQANRLTDFCINAGVGFSVNAVGNAMLCSREAGWVIFISIALSSLVTGFLGRFSTDSDSASSKNNPSADFSQVLVGSVSSSSQAMLAVCAFTAFFSGICAVTDELKNENLRLILSCLLEVTNACLRLSGKASLPLIAAVCAFGGICVHLQIFSFSSEFKPKILRFYVFRVIHSAMAFALCRIIIHFHPIETPVFLSFSKNAELFSFSAPASISLLFLCFLLISDLDNNKKIC